MVVLNLMISENAPVRPGDLRGLVPDFINTVTYGALLAPSQTPCVKIRNRIYETGYLVPVSYTPI
jgi:hypothetical protein